MIGIIKSLWSRKKATSTLAYALIIGLVGTVAITTTTQIGQQTSDVLDKTAVSMVGGKCVTEWGAEVNHLTQVPGFTVDAAPLPGRCQDVAVTGVCDGGTGVISPAVPAQNCDCPADSAPSLRDGFCRLVSPPQTTADNFDVPELIDGEEVTLSRQQNVSNGVQTWEATFMGDNGVPAVQNGGPQLISVACDSGYVRFDQSCVAAAASASCSGGPVPANATPYSVNFAQSWNGSAYVPQDVAFGWAESPSSDCQWSCDGGFLVNTGTLSSCHEETLTGTCQGLPTNAVPTTPGTYARFWTGTDYDRVDNLTFAPGAATCGFACDDGFILVGGECVTPEFTVTSYSAWSGPDSVAACLGDVSQTREITGCADQNGIVDVASCSGIGTTVRTVSSVSGDVSCDPQPANSIGGTQSCDAGSTTRSACTGFTCINGRVLVGGECVDPVYTISSYSDWSGDDTLAICGGTEEQSRSVTGCEDQLGPVDVSNCSGLGTLTRTISSPSGSVSCSPQPASSTGGTQSCDAGSTVRSACTGFSCTGGRVLVNGACVDPVFSVTSYSAWSGNDTLPICGGTEEQSRSITGCEDQNGSVDPSNCAGLGTLTRTVSSPSGSVSCSPQPANSAGGTQSCGAGSTTRSACSGFSCTGGRILVNGSCVDPIYSVTAFSGWSGSDTLAVCAGTQEQTRTITGCEDQNGSVAVSNCAGLGTLTRSVASPAGSVSCSPQPASSTGGTQSCDAGSSTRSACVGFSCTGGRVLVNGACVDPIFSVSSYSAWSGPDALAICGGTQEQTRSITGCEDQNGSVDVSNCAGLGTLTRSVASPSGSVSCSPQPPSSTGGTQSCAAGSTSRSACSGYTCTGGKILVNGSCVDPVYSVTSYSAWSGADTLAICGGTESQTRSITGCADQNGSVNVSNCSGLGTISRTVSSPSGSVSCSPQPAHSTGGTQSCTAGSSSRSACSGYTCTSGRILVGGECVVPSYSVTSYSAWSGPATLAACGGTQEQTRSITGCADQNGSVNVSNCAGLGTVARTVSSPSGDVSCSPQPANSSGGTQSCSAGSSSRSGCSGFSCNSGYTLSGGVCRSNCSAGTVSGYSVGGLVHGASSSVSRTAGGVSNGDGRFDATASCNNGSVSISNENLVITGCDAGYFLSGGNCTGVGTGYYSAAGATSRTACTNKPGNSSYTSSGGATNSCGWSCNSGFTQSSGSCSANCSAGSSGGYSWGNLVHGASSVRSRSVSITGGTQTRQRTASCSNGSVSLGSESITAVSCTSGNHQEGNACVSNTRSCSISNGAGSQTWSGSWSTCSVVSCNSGFTQSGNQCLANCSSGSSSGYSWPGLVHGASSVRSKTVNITGGTQTRQRTASCSSGSVTLGSESISAVSCSSGYTRSGDNCNPNGCGSASFDGYSVGALSHGVSSTRSKSVSISGGSQERRRVASCSLGSLSWGGETIHSTSCNSGYTQTSNSCSPNGCSSASFDGYSVGSQAHGGSSTRSKTVSISGGSQERRRVASCSLGSVSWGSESIYSTSCNSGYTKSGNSCVPNSCSSASFDGYSVGALSHGGSSTRSKTVSISGGSQVRRRVASCSLGSVSWGSESIYSTSCSSGYTKSGNSCLPNGCASASFDGYSVGTLAHGGSSTRSKTVSISGGSQVRRRVASCSLGSVSWGGESIYSTSCSTGYTKSGNSCVPNSCSSATFSGYSVGALSHGASSTRSKTVSITGGSQVRRRVASCSLGTVSWGSESIYSTSCSSGYTKSGNSCVPNGCSSASFDGYSVGSLSHGASSTRTKTVSISNGSQQRRRVASCSLGSVSWGSETIHSTSCNSGYSVSGNSCVSNDVCATGPYQNVNIGCSNGGALCDATIELIDRGSYCERRITAICVGGGGFGIIYECP